MARRSISIRQAEAELIRNLQYQAAVRLQALRRGTLARRRRRAVLEGGREGRGASAAAGGARRYSLTKAALKRLEAKSRGWDPDRGLPQLGTGHSVSPEGPAMSPIDESAVLPDDSISHADLLVESGANSEDEDWDVMSEVSSFHRVMEPVQSGKGKPDPSNLILKKKKKKKKKKNLDYSPGEASSATGYGWSIDIIGSHIHLSRQPIYVSRDAQQLIPEEDVDMHIKKGSSSLVSPTKHSRLPLQQIFAEYNSSNSPGYGHDGSLVIKMREDISDIEIMVHSILQEVYSMENKAMHQKEQMRIQSRDAAQQYYTGLSGTFATDDYTTSALSVEPLQSKEIQDDLLHLGDLLRGALAAHKTSSKVQFDPTV